MLEDTKLTRNELLSMFLIANEASEGIFGLSLIISNDNSLIDSIMALNSSLSGAGLASGISDIVAVKYGFSVMILLISKRFFP